MKRSRMSWRSRSRPGIDVINDGEQGRTDYTVHVIDRLTGFEGERAPPLGTGEPEFPELAAIAQPVRVAVPAPPDMFGPGGVEGLSAAARPTSSARRPAMTNAKAEEFFMTSPSPGQIARYLKNAYYKTEEEYLFTLADVMAREYKAIVDAGFVASARLSGPRDAPSHRSIPTSASRTSARSSRCNVEALNHAVKDLPADRMRMHVCWGSTLGPHHTDVPLKDIADIVLKAQAAWRCRSPAPIRATSTNGRSGTTSKLPDGKIIIPGVIDSTSNFVEHPEVVSDRIVQYAQVVGAENVIAGVDCGFGTFAGRVQVDTKIVWMKLASLAEGAAMAAKQLQ